MSEFVIKKGVLKEYSGNDAVIVVPEGVTLIYFQVFSGCGMEEVILPDSLVEIGPQAFESCEKLKTIYIPDSVKKIGSRAFYECSSLEKLVIPEGVEQVYARTFAHCTALKEINIPATVTKIGKEAFYNTRITELHIPAAVEEIDDRAFSCCPLLEEIENLSNASLLGAMKHTGADEETLFCAGEWTTPYGNLKKGFLPNEVLSELGADHKKVAVQCYLSCPDRYPPEKQAEYLAYIKKQGGKLFPEFAMGGDTEKLRKLLQVYAPKKDVLDQAIDFCREDTAVTALLLEYKNAHFDAAKEAKKEDRKIENMLSGAEPSVAEIKKSWQYKKNEAGTIYITAYKGEETVVTVPATIGGVTVAAVGEMAFSPYAKRITNKSARGNLTEVVLPDTVCELADCAFFRCYKLKHITMSKNVNFIGYNAFFDCPKLTIHAPEGSYAEKYAKENEIPFEAL